MKKCAVVLTSLFWLLAIAPAATAEIPPPELDPVLSLTGDCSESSIDPVPDPSCPYPAPPDGSSERLVEPRAIAVDPFGNEYVATRASSVDMKSRVVIFDDEGKFITEVAIPNVKNIAVDSEGNLYVFEDKGNIVRYSPSEYKPEAGEIAYGNPAVAVASGATAGALAIDVSTGRLFVVQGGELTIYRSAAEPEPNAVLDEAGKVGRWTEAIAVDAQRGRIYSTFCKGEFDECGVKVLGAEAPYPVLEEIYGPPGGEFATQLGRMGVAVDEETGEFFVADISLAKTVHQFSEEFEYLSQLSSPVLQFKNYSLQIAVSNGEKPLAETPCEYPDDPAPPLGDACNRHYLFVPVPENAGRALAFEPSDVRAPEIFGVATHGISQTEAELLATIDPHGAATDYRFEYTTLATYEAKGFTGAALAGGGTISGKSLTAQVDAQLDGLVPGETYRFRVVAENKVGKAVEESQNEGTFTTYDDAGPQLPVPCPNQALRFGLSASLPDCRAYELVTPANTNGRPPRGVGYTGSLFNTVHSSPAGDAVWFKIEGGSLPGTSGVGGFNGDPYVAGRGPSGWVTNLAGPTGDEATELGPASVSPDQGYLFWRASGEGSLVINDPFTEYLYYPDGHSELIGRGSLGTAPRAKGKLITENASHVIFETINSAPDTVAAKLESNAPPTGTRAVYDRTIAPVTGAEVTHVVSLLPGDVTPAAGEHATYVGASKDGEGIAFSIGSTLYLRVGNEATYEVGENVTFAGVSEGGERIFYVEGKDLKALDTTGSTPEVIDFTTTGDVTPVNVSSDGSLAYFVSPSVLGGTNPEGDSAQAGKQNLYLSEGGATAYVATVTDRDVEGDIHEGHQFDGLGLWTKVGHQIARDPSRLSPDGSVLLFQSRAEITRYPASEFPQIYRYDSDAGRLHCISCIPTGQSATGGASLESYTFDSASPLPFSPNGFVPNLTPDGDRVFFESTEALVSTDTDEVQDVYEWEEQGVGSCTRPGGCVYLISSGQSARDNFLYAHSTSGNDVFFTTGDALTGYDRDGTSIYDAKVGGGFPGPVEEDPCLADGCRPTVDPSPPVLSPSSPLQGESGNIKPGKSNRCPKGKRKVSKNGKVRCVKKKQHKKHKGKRRAGAGANRGAVK